MHTISVLDMPTQVPIHRHAAAVATAAASVQGGVRKAVVWKHHHCWLNLQFVIKSKVPRQYYRTHNPITTKDDSGCTAACPQQPQYTGMQPVSTRISPVNPSSAGPRAHRSRRCSLAPANGLDAPFQALPTRTP